MIDAIVSRYPFLSHISASKANVPLNMILSDDLFYRMCREDGLQKVKDVIGKSLSEIESEIDAIVKEELLPGGLVCERCEELTCMAHCPNNAIEFEIRSTGIKKFRRRVYELCEGCGKCLEHCYLGDSISIEMERGQKRSILAFFFARILVECIKDEWLRRRFAIFEAKKARKILENDEWETVKIVAKDFRIKMVENGGISIHVSDFIKASTSIREDRWKLTSRQLKDGFVRITKSELIRILEERIRERLEKRIRTGNCEKILPYLREIQEELGRLRGRVKSIKFDKVDFNSFPPCMKALITDIKAGKNIPHSARFALTSFLINVGMDTEEVVSLYSSAPDFDEEKTRYQVNHIARSRGETYIPPSCSTMKTYHNCINPDNLCKKISHPLGYYSASLKFRRRRKS